MICPFGRRGQVRVGSCSRRVIIITVRESLAKQVLRTAARRKEDPYRHCSSKIIGFKANFGPIFSVKYLQVVRTMQHTAPTRISQLMAPSLNPVDHPYSVVCPTNEKWTGYRHETHTGMLWHHLYGVLHVGHPIDPKARQNPEWVLRKVFKLMLRKDKPGFRRNQIKLTDDIVQLV